MLSGGNEIWARAISIARASLISDWTEGPRHAIAHTASAATHGSATTRGGANTLLSSSAVGLGIGPDHVRDDAMTAAEIQFIGLRAAIGH